jgi:hypothetical protein
MLRKLKQVGNLRLCMYVICGNILAETDYNHTQTASELSYCLILRYRPLQILCQASSHDPPDKEEMTPERIIMTWHLSRFNNKCAKNVRK